jgi:aryl-alcohol dehydrogenase-like predicted oxidoreductase
MQHVNLGRTGLEVSRLCLGTMNFGPETSEQDSFDIMDHALEVGINFFDTANVYGWKQGEGVTEKIIGRWLEQGGGRRDQVVLATKVYGKMGNGPNDHRLSHYHIRKACEDSLHRMKTDHIDLYQMHHVDRQTPWEEIWQAMEQLVQEGKVLYVGSSNFGALHLAQAQFSASARNFLGLASEQSLYNLSARMVELEIVPACRELGLGLIPWSPLAGGMLGGSGEAGARRSSEMTQKRIAENAGSLEAYEELCAELGQQPGDVALAWLLHNPDVTAPIIGPRTMEQLDAAVSALAIELSNETMLALDDIWPGPGGEAPEAYAW